MKPLDLEQFKSTPPYASELLGVYKPLLGWKARQAKERAGGGAYLVFKEAVSRFARDRRVEQSVTAHPRPVEPDDRFPVRFPNWAGSTVMAKIAEAIGPMAAQSTKADWSDAIHAADLPDAIAALAKSIDGAKVEPPAGVVVLDAARVPDAERKAVDAQAVPGTGLLVARTGDREVPEEWRADDHDLVFLRSDELSEAQLTTLGARELPDTGLAVAAASPTMATSHDLTREAALAGTLRHLAAGSSDLLSPMLLAAPAWSKQLAFVNAMEQFRPTTREAVLSPVALVDVFREYFFEFDAFLGPSVAHVWVSPGGGVELYEVHTRRTREEREIEIGEEAMTRSEKEIAEEDEISTAVGEENSRDIKMGVSVHGSTNFGVVQAGAEANLGLDFARKTTQEEAHKHARRQSEKLTSEIRRNFKTTFKTSVETEDVSSRRYVLQNDTKKLVNYELRRKMRRVGVQLHHIGTMLCWQVHIDDPGAELGVAELIHVAKPDDFGSKNPPPEAPPAPQPKQSEHTVDFPYESTTGADDEDDVTYYKGDDQEGGLNNNDFIVWQRQFKLAPPAAGYKLDDVKQLSADRVNPDEDPPSVSASFKVIDAETFQVDLDQVNFNDQPAIRFGLQAIWSPPDNSAEQLEYLRRRDEYNELKQREADAALVAAARERVKLASGIAKRPMEELRDEERAAIYRRMIGKLTKIQITPGEPHVTAELVRSIFDIDKMLYFVAPDWWQPRQQAEQQLGANKDGKTLLTDENLVGWGGKMEQDRDNYFITEDSAPAPLGASLGWLLQLDGDNHRNMFLNAAWALAVLPVREGKELEALEWLKLEQVEGTDGLGATYAGTEPGLRGQTLDEVLHTLAERLEAENSDVKNELAGETVFEHGFDPLEGGFKATGEPYEVFDQWIEILPTDQVVAVEYEPDEASEGQDKASKGPNGPSKGPDEVSKGPGVGKV